MPTAPVKAGEGKAAPAAAKEKGAHSSFGKVLSQKDESKRSEKKSSKQLTKDNSDSAEENLNEKTEISSAAAPQAQTQEKVSAPKLNLVNGAKSVEASTEESAQAPEDTDRREIWNNFLGQMNSLGVSAEKIVKAFSSLTAEELSKPPEQTVDKLVLALGLNPTQAQAAKAFFNELLTKTKSNDVAQEAKAPKLALVQPNDLPTRDVKASKREQAAPTQAATPTPAAAPEKTEEAAAPKAEKQEAQAEPKKFEVPNSNQPQAPAQPQAAALNKVVEQMQPVTPEEAAALEETLKNAPKKMTAEQLQANAAPVAAAMTQAPAQTIPQAPQMPTMTALMEKLGLQTNKDKDSSAGEDSADGKDLSNGLDQQLTQNMIGAQGKTEFQGHLSQAGGATATAQAQPVMTMPELVQNAQVMLKDGGGEMKVTLKQEGLGEVAMKVSVENGKVNVAMITQTDEAKKLLEHQLGELKTGLASNHLQVESIKIDTSAQLKAQLENQGRDAQRQQTQAQWEQFRQDSGGWKRNYFETGSLGGAYAGQGRGPRDIAAPQAAQAAGSRRLNLVA